MIKQRLLLVIMTGEKARETAAPLAEEFPRVVRSVMVVHGADGHYLVITTDFIDDPVFDNFRQAITVRFGCQQVQVFDILAAVPA